jgi:uncharacterized protein YjbI with pentapeptide repeats
MLKRCRDWLKKHVMEPVRPFYPTIKVLEVLGIIAALIAFTYDFMVEKPRDRAVANASMYAQIASLDPKMPTYRPAMQAMINTLLAESIDIDGLDIPAIDITNVNLDKIEVRHSHLDQVKFSRVDIDGGRFVGVTGSMVLFGQTEFRNFSFLSVKGGWLKFVPLKQLRNGDRSTFDRMLKVTRMPDFVHTGFFGSTFREVVFEGVSFFESELRGAEFQQTSMKQVVLVKTTFLGSRDRNWDLLIENSYLSEVSFSELTSKQMKQIRFVDCIFEAVKFPEGYELPEGAGVVLE